MMVATDLLRPLVGVVGVTLLSLKLRWPGPTTGWAAALIAGPVVAGLCGALFAWSVPPWAHVAGRVLVEPLLLLFAGWVGLRIGCGLDLRIVRRSSPLSLLVESGTAVGIALLFLTLVLAGSQTVPWAPALPAGALLVLVGVCVAGPALPGSDTAGGRGTSRGGFWTPSSAAATAVLLAAVGTSLEPGLILEARLPWIQAPVVVEVEGTLERLVWGVGGGCMAGLLADLATRDDFTPGGLYPQLAAVALIASGVAGTAGLEPLLVGVVAGFWLINATLRRLDILHVVGRASMVPRLAVPFLAGWIVGQGLGAQAFDGALFVAVLGTLLVLRPAARLVALRSRARVGGAGRPRHRRAHRTLAGVVDIDALGVLLAATLSRLLEPAAAAAVVAAVLVAQALLGAGGRWWDESHASGSGPLSARA